MKAPEFPWKTVSVTTSITREEWDRLRKVPVREPWLRRLLIRMGWKSLQRYREESNATSLERTRAAIHRNNELMTQLKRGRDNAGS